MNKVIEDVLAERRSQNEKWGIQDHNPVEWVSILTEEVGEAAQQANDLYFGYNIKNNSAEEDLFNIQQNIKAYREELIQAAAVAVQMVESLDRQLEQSGPTSQIKH